MTFFKNTSIRNRLNLLVTSVVTLALVIASLAFAFHGTHEVRQSRLEQVRTLASVLQANVIAALEFLDTDSAQQMLSSLRNQPYVKCAVLLDAHGEVFATYPADLSAQDIATINRLPEAKFSDDGDLDVGVVVTREGDQLGTLVVRSSTTDLRRQIHAQFFISAGVLVATLLITSAASGRLQKAFTAPLLELAAVMDRISTDRDYTLRMNVRTNDELGTLCDGFNDMLDCIQSNQAELQDAHDRLEDRVNQRTLELSHARDSAEAASRAKSEFLAKMSHEIRTPMAAILGYADLLLEPDQSAKDRGECVSTIRRNGNHLLSVINDILDISKIESGRMTIEKIDSNPVDIVQQVASLMRCKATEKQLTLATDFDGHIPLRIHTDPTRLRQALLNLVGNAIKFTNQGTVTLTTRLLPAAKSSERILEFTVADTGIGMTADQVGRLFKPFSQGDDSMNRRFGGTGLGLVISRSFARLLGGDLVVSSIPGAGSRFTLTINAGSLADVAVHTPSNQAEPAPATSQKQSAVSLTGLRVLLVEDGPDNQKLISFVLRKSGAEVEIADNGQVGMQAALEALQQERPFDVVLTDMQMPVMDGYEATTRLRHAGYQYPIVALTAHAMKDDARRCLDAGCDDYQSKPIDKKGLIACVSEWARRGQDPAWRSRAVIASTTTPAADISSANTTDRPGEADAAEGDESCDTVTLEVV